MTYFPGLIVHIGGGIVGRLSGATALVVRKGSPLHRSAGKVFVISMLLMSSSGAYQAAMKPQPGNILGGVITFYLIATAWLTVIRLENETGLLERGLVPVAVAAGIGALILGWKAAHSATGSLDGNPAAPYFVFGALALLSAAGGVRMFVRGGVSGVKRLVRHLWRMDVALFIATASFFLGTANSPVQLLERLFTKAVRQTHPTEVSVIIIALVTMFWLWRVRSTKVYRKAEQ